MGDMTSPGDHDQLAAYRIQNEPAPDATATPAGERDYEAEAALTESFHRQTCSEPWDACCWSGEDPALSDCHDAEGRWRPVGLERLACSPRSPAPGSADAAPDDGLRAAVEALADQCERLDVWLCHDRTDTLVETNRAAWTVLRNLLAQHPAATGEADRLRAENTRLRAELASLQAIERARAVGS